MRQEMPYINTERSIIKQFRKKVWRLFVKGLQDCETIKDGDKVAVCISDGKDSMLLAKCLQRLERQSRTDFELEFIVMDPGYNPDNKSLAEDSAALMNIPVRIFNSGIFDIVVDVEQSPCYPYVRMRRGYLYAHTRELGCNKIALGRHSDDVVETTLMGILYEDQISTMVPKLHSTNFQGVELIRPLHYVKEEGILNRKDYDGPHFLQCTYRFTEWAAKKQAARGMAEEAAGIVHTSKRQEIKELIHSLRKTDPSTDANIMKSVENTSLGTCLGYVRDGVRRRFMDECDEGWKRDINHLLSAQIFLKDYKRWQVLFMELIKRQIHVDQWKDDVTTQITLDGDFIVPDALDDMEQVMLDAGEIQTGTVKNQRGKVAVKGKLEFQMLYRKESGGLQTLGGNIPFEEAVNVRGLEEKDYVGLNWMLEDLNVDMVNSRKLGVQTIITLQVRVETLRGVEAAVDMDMEDNSRPAGAGMSDTGGARQMQVKTLKCMANAVAIAVRRRGAYRVKEELSLTRDKPNTDQLLWRGMKLRNVTTKPLDGRLHLDGEFSAFVIYEAEDKNMPVQWLEETVPFSGNIKMGNVKEG